MSVELEARVLSALDEVRDPCSVAAGAPLSVVDLGLLLGVQASPTGKVEVRLRTTGPMCLMVGHISAEVDRRIRVLPGVTSVEVQIDSAAGWTADDIAPRGQAVLERRRKRERAVHRLRPYEWRNQR